MSGGSLEGERPQPEDTIEIGVVRGQATDTTPRPGPAVWSAAAASTIGSVHVRDGIPIQDAVLTWAEGDRAVVAVADGHGHHTHFRSDTGAALAVVAAVEEVRRSLTDLAAAPVPEDALATVAAAIVATWRLKVEQHRAASPLEPTELEAVAGDPLRPYGTTLLVCGVVGDLVVCLQIGDGDAVFVDSTGMARRAVADHPDLDGVRTHSLCQPEPLAGLRTCAVRTSLDAASEVALVFLCTDGFGGSRVDRDWWQQTGEQLVGFTRERGIGWVREQMGSWLAEPALVGGDDTTLAVLVRSELSPA